MVRDQSAVVSISPGGSDTHAGLGHKMEEIKFTTEELSRRYSNKCLWWSRRTGFERTLVVISIFLFVACMVLVLVNILIEVKIRNQAKTAPKICNTEECIHAASRILERIDPTSDPCNDFYQFACGSYAEKHTVPDDYFIRSLMQTMQDDLMVKVKKLLEVPVESEDGEGITKAKMLYSSCMNTSSVEDESIVQLQELLSEAGVGEWPSLTPGWNKTDLGLEWRLARLNFHQVEPFFHSYISRDDKNSSNFLLHLHSDTSVLSPDYYLNATEENQAYIQLYRELITETLRLLDADSKQAAEDVEDMIAFETAFAELAKLSYSQMAFMNESLDDYLNFDRKTLSDLEEILPDIRWSELMHNLLSQANITVDEVDLHLVLHCEDFLRKTFALINSTSPRTVVNYLSWRFVIKYMRYLDIHFRRLYYDFKREIPHSSDERTFFSRWKECVSLVQNNGFGMALAALFVRHEYTEKIDREIKELIVAVKLAFSQLIKSQSWLDNETTERCKKQLKGMREKIAYPSYILDPDQLSHDYKGLEIKPGDFLDNVLRMNRYEMKKELEKMTRTVDKEKDWYVQPLMVNAFYQSSGNDVIFPVGILRPPLFVPGRPQYLNYGSLGIVIGHELAHSFDTSGRKLDLSGNSTQWWSEDVKEILQEKVACFVDQYSKFPLKEVDQNVDGNHTLQENICDHSAVQQAYLAYLNYVAKHGQEAGLPGVKYTNQQIFFIQFAQVWCEVLNKDGYIKYTTDGHSPGQYRTNGALQNSQFFAEAFSCTLGSPMNPENKCGLWG
ncbi:neprilysin-1-like isoform X1 [Tachypleus tridentatus]|uniref:neprilysin-1-like isoform X1 n=1 Tax=Tachypleus tridentatus TaxID=6853 RepID=UPI003FD29E24